MTGMDHGGAGQVGEGFGAISYESAFFRVRQPLREDFDQLGHVNNIVYVRWVQEIAIEHWQTIVREDVQRQYIWVVLRHEIDYRDALLPGDAAEIRTWVGAAKGPRFDRHVDIRKPGADRPAARALTVWCLLDARTRRPLRVNEDMLRLFGVPT